MLAFYLNNQPFSIEVGASVKLKWRNPACNFKEFPGDIGMGISIPVNDINRALLGNPERFERHEQQNIREYENFEIRYGGHLLMGGTFIIQSADNEKYTGWLRSNVGNLGKEHREKFIFDSVSFNEEKSFENKADYNPLTDDYGCPKIFNPEFFTEKGEKTTYEKRVLNPDYVPLTWWQDIWRKQEPEYENKTVETEDLTHAFAQTAGWIVNKQDETGKIKTPTSECNAKPDTIKKELQVTVVSPMLFLNYLLKTIIKDADFYLDKNFIADDPDLQKLILYNNFDITRMTYYTQFTPAVFTNYLDSVINTGVGIAVDRVKRDIFGKFLYKSLVPQIKLKDFFLSVGNLVNVFPFFRTGRRIIDIIDRESILTGASIDVGKYLTGFWLMGEKKDLTLKFTFEHDDADIYFKDQWENIDEFRDNEKEAVDTWDDLQNIENPEMGDIRFIRNQNTYAQYKLWLLESTDNDGNQVQKKYIGWKHLTIGFQNGFFNYGKEEEEKIPTKFSTIAGETIPRTDQLGNIPSELFAYENFSPRLLFYLGNNQASYKTNNIALDWEKEEIGLLATRWRHWSRFWATRQHVKCEAYFPLNVLDYVIRHIYKKFRSREGEFIIEEMETEFGINQISTTKIRGFKLNYFPNTHKLTEMAENNDIVWIDEYVDFNDIDINRFNIK